METYYILDASGFINGFIPDGNLNFTVPEITEEIKDFKSRLLFDELIKDNKLKIIDVENVFYDKINDIISKSGDDLRLSKADKMLLSLALMFRDENKEIKVITDDYSIQNVLKILNLPFESIITSGIKEVYNWKKICEGCKKEFSNDYDFDDCDVCGSRLFKKRIKI